MNVFQPRFISTILATIAFACGVATPLDAEARPQYREVFAKKYPALAEQVNKVKCGVCHPPGAAEKKKVRNNYGQALQKVLNAKNVTEKDTILKALTKIESENSANEGKTFGELIKAGTLPGKNE